VQVVPDGSAVLFLQSGPRDPVQRLFEHDVASGLTRELVTPAALLGGRADVISEAEAARRERQRITDQGFVWFDLAPDGASVLVTAGGALFAVPRAGGTPVRLLPPDDLGVQDPRFSPDGRHIAFVRGNDLWVIDADGAAPPRPLTTGGTPDLLRGMAEFVAQEEMARHEGYWWAPDSRRLLYAEVDQAAVERFAIADPSRPERPPTTFRYPRPGRANAAVRLELLELGDPSTRVGVTWERERYPYVARVLWDHGAPLAVLVQTRDQREQVLLAVDEATGSTRPLVIERDEAWCNLGRDLPRWLPEGRGLLWASETEGARSLELRRLDGSLDRVLLGPEAGFLSVVHVGHAGGHVSVLLGDAVACRLERLALDTGARTVILPGGEEHVPALSRDGGLIVDLRATPSGWPAARLHRGDGLFVRTLPDRAEVPPFGVNLSLVQVTGARLYNAAVVRPRSFDPGDRTRRYPVIVHVYGGPHSLMVKSDARAYLYDQWLADHGAIVLCLDNRGTPRRDRAWERAIKGRLLDVPLEDQVDGLQALGRQFPELDLSRVGIYGWSFGGTMAAAAVLRRPDVFHVAVAGAPVTDWRDYDTHYTERYLDLPDVAPDAYPRAGLLADAARPATGPPRPLLLIHGTADDNVYFFHSMKLCDALLRAGRQFDFLPLPRVTHQLGDAAIREQVHARMAAYLARHLGLEHGREGV
jgi:dipeptidyl-peptidase-4